MRIGLIVSHVPMSAPTRATQGAVDSVQLGEAEAPTTLAAARRLFEVDAERARHVLASVKIDDIREHQGTYFYPPTPTFTPGGKLIVGTNKGTILAFDARGEKELWRHETGTVSAYNDPFCTRDGRLLFSNRKDPELLCLKEDGTLDYQLALPAPLFSDIQSDSHGNAYVCTETVLLKLDKEGREVWRREVPERAAAVVTTPDDRVLLITEQGLSRLDERGQDEWSHSVPLTAAPVFTPDNSMFLTTATGVEVVKPDGTVLQADELPGPPSFLEADARGNVIVVTEDAHLASLDTDGKIRKQRRMWSALPSAPIVRADGTVLLCTARSEILVFDSDLEVVGGHYLPNNKPGERTIGLKTPQVAPNGAIYVTKDGNQLDVLSAEGRPAFMLEGYHRTSADFSPEGVLAVAHWDQVHLLQERSLQEVLQKPEREPEPGTKIERQGDFLVVGGSMVRVRKPKF